MDAVSAAKGVTSVSAALSTGTGIYMSTSGGVYVSPEYRGKIGGKLILEGNKFIDEEVTSWNANAKRYVSYLSFKENETNKELEISNFTLTTTGSEMKTWCEGEFKKEEDSGDYKKVKKWCTRHETMEEHMESEGFEVDLTKPTESSHSKLLSSLGSDSDDVKFLNKDATDASKKKARAILWCQKKSDMDYEDGGNHYETFKEVCGKKSNLRSGV